MSRSGPRRPAASPAPAGPSKRELLEELQIDASGARLGAANKAKKSYLLAAPSGDRKVLPGSKPGAGVVVHGDSTEREYRSKAYWSNASANIEEMLSLLLDMRSPSSSSSSSRGSGAETRYPLGGLVAVSAAALPEWNSAALLGLEPGGLYAGMAVCDSVMAYSDRDGAAEVLTAVHAYVHDAPEAGVKVKVAAMKKASSTTATPADKHVANHVLKIGSRWSFLNQSFSYSCHGRIAADGPQLAAVYAAAAGAGAGAGAAGEAKTRMLGWLRGKTPQGRIHIRPLCTPSDLVIAMKEMCDPAVFDAAYVQMPRSFPEHGQPGSYALADKNCYYRLHYRLNESGVWIKLSKPAKPPVPLNKCNDDAAAVKFTAAHDELKKQQQQKRWQQIGDFLCPHLHFNLFDKVAMDQRHVPAELRRAGTAVVRSLQYSLDRTSGEVGSQLLSEAVLDFEELRLVGDVANYDNGKGKGKPASLAATVISYPLTAEKRFRLMHVVQTRKLNRLAQQRRVEIHSISGEKRLFLQHFSLTFEEEFKRRFFHDEPKILQEAEAGVEAQSAEGKEVGAQDTSSLIPIPTHDHHALITHKEFRSRNLHTRHNIYNQAVLHAAATEAAKMAEGMWAELNTLRSNPHTAADPVKVPGPRFEPELQLPLQERDLCEDAELGSPIEKLGRPRSWKDVVIEHNSKMAAHQLGDMEDEDDEKHDEHIHIPPPIQAVSTREKQLPGREESKQHLPPVPDPLVPPSVRYAGSINSYRGKMAAKQLQQQAPQDEDAETGREKANSPDNSLSYLAEYMQKALHLHIMQRQDAGADAPPVKAAILEENRSQNQREDGRSLDEVTKEVLQLLDRSRQDEPKAAPSAVAAVAAVGGGKAGTAVGGRRPMEAVSPNKANPRDWEEEVPQYIHFLNMWRQAGIGEKTRKKKHHKGKSTSNNISTKKIPKQQVKAGSQAGVLYENPVNHLLSPRVLLEAKAARDRYQRTAKLSAENAGKALTSADAEAQEYKEWAENELHKQIHNPDSAFLEVANELATTLSLTDILTGMTAAKHAAPAEEDEDCWTIRPAEAVDSVEEEISLVGAIQMQVRLQREAHTQALEAERNKDATQNTRNVDAAEYAEEDRTKRREIDADWPTLKGELDDKFHPYVSFEREEDGPREKRKQRNALRYGFDAVGASRPLVLADEFPSSPSRYNSSLADEREIESNRMLEYFLSFMPSTMAGQIRAGINNRARIVYNLRRQELMARERSDHADKPKKLSREAELIDYMSNLDKWQYVEKEKEEEKEEEIAIEEMKPVDGISPKKKKTPSVLLPMKREIKSFLRTLVNLQVRRTILDGEMVSEDSKKYTLIERIHQNQHFVSMAAACKQQEDIIVEGNEDEADDAEMMESSESAYSYSVGIARPTPLKISMYARDAALFAAAAAANTALYLRDSSDFNEAEESPRAPVKPRPPAGGGKWWGPSDTPSDNGPESEFDASSKPPSFAQPKPSAPYSSEVPRARGKDRLTGVKVAMASIPEAMRRAIEIYRQNAKRAEVLPAVQAQQSVDVLAELSNIAGESASLYAADSATGAADRMVSAEPAQAAAESVVKLTEAAMLAVLKSSQAPVDHMKAKNKGLVFIPGHNIASATSRQPVRPQQQPPSRRTVRVVIEDATATASSARAGTGAGADADAGASIKPKELQFAMDMNDEEDEVHPAAMHPHEMRWQENSLGRAHSFADSDSRDSSTVAFEEYAYTLEQLQMHSLPTVGLEEAGPTEVSQHHGGVFDETSLVLAQKHIFEAEWLASSVGKESQQTAHTNSKILSERAGAEEMPRPSCGDADLRRSDLTMYTDSIETYDNNDPVAPLLEPAPASARAPASAPSPKPARGITKYGGDAFAFALAPSSELVDADAASCVAIRGIARSDSVATRDFELAAENEEVVSAIEHMMSTVEARADLASGVVTSTATTRLSGAAEGDFSTSRAETLQAPAAAQVVADAAMVEKPRLGMLSFKVEKPKHPPVRHTSIRLYDSNAIKAKRARQLQMQEQLEKDRSDEEKRRSLGLPVGMTMQTFMNMSNRAIYSGLDLFTSLEQYEAEDASDDEDMLAPAVHVHRMPSPAREVAKSFDSEEMVAAADDLEGNYRMELARQQGNDLHIQELIGMGLVWKDVGGEGDVCLEGREWENIEALQSQSQVEQDKAIVQSAQLVVRAVLEEPLSGLSLADYLIADEASRDRENEYVGADKTGDVDDYTQGAGTEQQEGDYAEFVLSPAVNVTPECLQPASNTAASEAIPSSAPAPAPAPAPAQAREVELNPLMGVSKYNIPAKNQKQRVVRQLVPDSDSAENDWGGIDSHVQPAEVLKRQTAVYAPKAPSIHKAGEYLGCISRMPLTVGGRTLNIPSVAAVIKEKADEEQLHVQLLVPPPAALALVRAPIPAVLEEPAPPASMVVSLKAPSVTVKQATGRSVLYATESKKYVKPASKHATQKVVLASTDFTSEVILPQEVSRSLRDFKREPCPAEAGGDIRVHRTESSPRPGDIDIATRTNAIPLPQPGPATHVVEMPGSKLETAHSTEGETAHATVYFAPSRPLVPKAAHDSSMQGPGALVSLRMKESLEAVSLQKRFRQEGKMPTPNFGVAGRSASGDATKKEREAALAIGPSASPRLTVSSASGGPQSRNRPAHAVGLETTGSDPLGHRARNDANKIAKVALQHKEQEQERKKKERKEEIAIAKANTPDAQSKARRMSTEYVSKVRGRTTGHSVRIAGHIDDREVGPVTYDRGLVDLLRRPSPTNLNQQNMYAQEFDDSLPPTPMYSHRPSAAATASPEEDVRADLLTPLTAVAEIIEDTTVPSRNSVLNEQRSILDEANAQMDFVRKAFQERERLQQQVEAMAAGLEAHEAFHRNMLEEIERGLMSHPDYGVPPLEPAVPFLGSKSKGNVDTHGKSSLMLDVGADAIVQVEEKENSPGNGYIGNKSPAKMSGLNTTMADIRCYDRSNVIDVGLNIENMRMPKSVVNHSVVDSAEVRSLVMHIDSTLSNSQEQERAFIEEEMRRRQELSRLMHSIQIHGTTSIPSAGVAQKAPQDKVLNIKSKARDLVGGGYALGCDHAASAVASAVTTRVGLASPTPSFSPPFAISPAKFTA